MGFEPSHAAPLKGDFQDQGALCANVAALTDIGQKRKNNEDNYLVLPLDGEVLRQSTDGFTFSLSGPGLLLAVADGMGGHQSGEVASRLCVESLGEELLARLPQPRTAAQILEPLFKEAVEATHGAIFAASQRDPALEGMGCTLTGILLYSNRADVAQVGDSRAYLFRDGNLTLLTQDQTVGNLLRAADGPPLGDRVNDILTQAMGAQQNVNAVMSSTELRPLDDLLICCDGLYKVVPDAEIAAILAWEAPLHDKAERLISQANQHGGPDNITVVLAEIRARPDGAP
ncbi:MAG: PP2C family protein-serine/threonine phosphatase [Terriglobia bacterium]